MAATSNCFENFCQRLTSSGRHSGNFEKHLVRLCGSRESAFGVLNRLEIVIANEPALTSEVDWRIRSVLRRKDDAHLNPTETRSLIAEFAISNLGNRLTEAHLKELLKRNGYELSMLAGNDSVSHRLSQANRAYINGVRSHQINDVPIQRQECDRVIELLTGGAKAVSISGTAGVGKSSVAAEVVHRLIEKGIPCLAVRVDEFSDLDRSARAIGAGLGLPESPVITLGEFAGNKPSVLCFDQIDALSIVSGRRQAAWRPFRELLEETKNYGSMRLMFACRDFDLDIDSRIKSVMDEDHGYEQVRIDPFAEEVVLNTVRAAGITRKFTPEQIQVLSIPLHLFLFLESSRTDPVDFTAAGDLFDAYWKHKSRAVRDLVGNGSAWSMAIKKLCDELSERESLSTPIFALDEFRTVVDAMASESVVTIYESNVRFFHESFFDYCFARSFLRSNIDLVDWLLAGGQHLFRRSQVRQVLAFLRGYESDYRRYTRTLDRLLGNPGIRFHIKKLVLDWLRACPDPTGDEWDVITDHVSCLGIHAENVPFNSVPWFDRLYELGQWKVWLEKDDRYPDLAIGLLRAPRVLELRSNLVAELVRPFVGKSKKWRQRLRILATSTYAHYSDEMQDLVVELVTDGTLDEAKPEIVANGDWWLTWYGLGGTSPRFAARLIGAWIDRAIERAISLRPEDPNGAMDTVAPFSQHSENLISECASKSPNEFVIELLPRLVSIDRRFPQHLSAVPRRILNPIEQLQDALFEATGELAKSDPELLDSTFDSAIQDQSVWTSALLLNAWSKNPDRYADRIAEFVLRDPERRLNIGAHVSMTDSDTFIAISRRAIASAAQTCSDRNFFELENKILHIAPGWEVKHRSIGRTELALLRALPIHRTSQLTNKRISELQRRFPDAPKYAAPESKPTSRGASWVQSPIPAHAHELMTDDQWIGAMSTYRDDEVGLVDGRVVGGALQLSRELAKRASVEPHRFSELPKKMDSSHSNLYFEAILRGLTEAKKDADRPGSVEQVHSVLTRVWQLGVQIDRQVVARAIGSLADEKMPTDLLVALREIAMFDPDPAGGQSYLDVALSDDHYAFNSARGVAGFAISQLLFADRSRWAFFEPAVKKLIVDPVQAVRPVAANCLLAVLDSERGEAFASFEELVQGPEEILKSHFVGRFLHYAIFRDYWAMRPTLVRMLTSENPQLVQTAAQLLTLAALWIPDECAEIEFVLSSGEDARVGAAKIFVDNLTNESVGAECEARLCALFSDQSPVVRQEASNCWGGLQPDEIASRGKLILAYSDSIGCEDNIGYLLHRLKSATIALPRELHCLAVRVLAAYGESASSIHNWEAGALHGLPTLMIRLHEESGDPQFRESILDVIDQMVRANVLGASEELVNQFDR